LTVNQPPNGIGGSSPPTPTNRYFRPKLKKIDKVHNLGIYHL
jgi:hypothetical protein